MICTAESILKKHRQQLTLIPFPSKTLKPAGMHLGSRQPAAFRVDSSSMDISFSTGNKGIFRIA